MQRLRLKADGRIVELRDGQEAPLAPGMYAHVMNLPSITSPALSPRVLSVLPAAAMPLGAAPAPQVRELRRRARLTQAEFAAKLCVPIETIRNWEQGKRMPRGPARALLAVIAHAPDTVFAALASNPPNA